MVLQITQQMSPNQFDLWRESGVPDVAGATRKAVDVSALNMELEKAKAMFPIELHVAKMKSELADLDLARSKVQNSSDMLALLAEDTKLGLQQGIQSKKNMIELQAHTDDFMQLASLAKTNPSAYLAKHKALSSVLRNNPQAQVQLNQMNEVFDSIDFHGVDGTTQKGSYFRLSASADPAGYQGVAGMSRAQLDDASYKESENMLTQDLVRRGFTLPQIIEFKNARSAKLKSDILNTEASWKMYTKLGGFVDQERAMGRELLGKRMEKDIAPGGLTDAKLRKTGNVGDTDINDMALGSLVNMRMALQAELDKGPESIYAASAGEIQSKIDKIDLLSSQIETTGFHWWKVVPWSAKGVRQWGRIAEAMPWANNTETEAEFDAFVKVRDLASAGNKEEAYKALSQMLWDFDLNKSLTQIVRRRQAIEGMAPSAVASSDINDIIRGGTSLDPRGTVIGNYAPNQARQLTLPSLKVGDTVTINGKTGRIGE